MKILLSFILFILIPFFSYASEESNPVQISSTEYKAMLTALIEESAPETVSYFTSKVTDYSVPLTRGQAVMMSWYAAVCIGADTYNNDFDHSRADGGDFWDSGNEPFEQLFPDCYSEKYPVVTERSTWDNEYIAAFLWNLWHSSPVSGLQVVAFDEKAQSMRNHEPFFYDDAVSAIDRLRDSREFWIDSTDERARYSGIIADSDKSPLSRLAGFVLTDDYGSKAISATASQISQIASWGFTSVRIMATYETFFEEDCTKVNLTSLYKLDTLIQAAIDNHIHLNFLLMTLPGRTAHWDPDTAESTGEFDLFVNPEKMAQAKAIWKTFAERYRDVPGEYLSFSPMWEALNRNLSTGLDFPDYSIKEAADCLENLIAVIREADPDRYIIYELTANNPYDVIIEEDGYAYQLISEKYDNVRISFNFCEMPYVYAEMTATEGEHIDNNNHSLFKPEYPVKIYSANRNLDGMTIDGCLPTGTRIDIYISRFGPGKLTINNGKEDLYSEVVMESQKFETSYVLSWFYPYSTSEKKISILLNENTDHLSFNGWAEWSGIDVYLPESYGVERWYTYTPYDAFLNGNPEAAGARKMLTSRVMIAPNDDISGKNITIHDDVTYSSENIFAQSTKETVESWGKAIHDFAPDALVRFERAFFYAGTTADSALRYYEDVLSMLDEYGYDWYSNDYKAIIDSGYQYYGAHLIEYEGYASIDIDLLKLLQRHISVQH